MRRHGGLFRQGLGVFERKRKNPEQNLKNYPRYLWRKKKGAELEHSSTSCFFKGPGKRAGLS